MGMRWRPLSVLMAATVALGACGGALGTPAKTKDPLAGDYTGKGAAAASEAVKALTKRFAELHPGVNFTLVEIDTETSIVNVNQGDVDFGYIGRDPKAAEPKIALTPIGFTGSGIAVNAANPVKNLTKDQIRKIFTGEIKDWGQVGGDPGPIKVFVREATSSTRTTIESFVFGSDKPTYTPDKVEIFESEDTIKAIGSFKAAIGTLTLSGKNASDPTIRFVSIDGTPATVAELNGGAWKIRRPLYFTTASDPAKVKPAIAALVEFIKSPDGQKIVASQ